MFLIFVYYNVNLVVITTVIKIYNFMVNSICPGIFL